MALLPGTVVLEEYNPKWIDMFEIEKTNLEKVFKDNVLTIEHIGSTSIVGLKAKPIIDIGIGVDNLDFFDNYKTIFNKYPYSYKISIDDDEILLKKHDKEATSYLIHIMPINSERYKNTILFRDYLNNHSDVLKDYQNLKEQLAKKYANERKKYTASKNDFIQQILKKAKDETI